MQKEKKVSSKKLCDTIVEGMQENKAKDITVLDLRKISGAISDYFIICSGDSNTQLDGISTSIQKYTRKELKEKPWHIEGKNGSEWILLDYVNVVVHIFQKELRSHYDLEDLWADADVTRIPDLQ